MYRRQFRYLQICYACGEPSTSMEHAPPRSFFPRRFRKNNLLTVPSCAKHNNEKSDDVDYAHCTICFQAGLNAVADEAFEEAKVIFGRSPALTARIHAMMQERVVGLKVEPTLRFELKRLQDILIGIAQAVHFNIHGKHAPGQWHVLPPLHTPLSLQGGTDEWSIKRAILSSLPYVDTGEPVPEVFVCEAAQMEDGNAAYRLTLYGGFVAYVWSGPYDPARLVAKQTDSSLWIP